MDSVKESSASGTQYLLMAAGDVPEEPVYNKGFADAAPYRSEYWEIEGVGHTAGYSEKQQEYQQKVLEFFDGVLQ